MGRPAPETGRARRHQTDVRPKRAVPWRARCECGGCEPPSRHRAHGCWMTASGAREPRDPRPMGAHVSADAPPRPLLKSILGIAIVILVAGRLLHMTGPLDDPHAWRQCDTVETTRCFVRGGIDLLHPQVSWLGGHGTLIFELPLPEAAAALPGRLFGFSPVWDRVVTLASFVAALAFLFLFVRALAGARVATWAALLYALFPLGQFFSRAPTADFPATACAHGLLWFGWRAARGGNWRDVIWAAVLGGLAAGIKGPYVLPVAAALLPVWLVADRAGRLRAGTAIAATAVAFLAWRAWVNHVNAAAPDWTWL